MHAIVEQRAEPGSSVATAVVDRTVRAERGPTSATIGARDGARDIVPFVVAMVPFAMVLGVAIDASGVSDLVGVVLTPVVFAASSQFAAMSVLDSGGSALAAVLTALVVSARFSMYSAALAHRFREQPAWFRWLGPWLIVDQTFAVAAMRDERDRTWFRAYWLTAGGLLGVVFTAATTVGVVVGPIVPDTLRLEFTIPALFVAMLVGRARERPALVAALVGGLVTALALELPHGLGLLAGGLSGAAASVVYRRLP